MTPKQAIKIQCRFCKNQMVFDCESQVCKLYLEDITTLKKIRLHCLDCAGSSDEAKGCDGVIINKLNKVECSLWNYRFGTNPKRKGIGRTGGNPNIRSIHKKDSQSQTHKQKKGQIACET